MLQKAVFVAIVAVTASFVSGRGHLGLAFFVASAAAVNSEIGFSHVARRHDAAGPDLRLAQKKINPDENAAPRVRGSTPGIDPDNQGGARLTPPPGQPAQQPPRPPPPPIRDITYRVIGVAANDVLNIRSGPNSDMAIVGTIPPDAGGIRMEGGCTGQWCPISYRGVRGWVNRRFLAGE